MFHQQHFNFFQFSTKIWQFSDLKPELFFKLSTHITDVYIDFKTGIGFPQSDYT